jgi:hypothetical protein
MGALRGGGTAAATAEKSGGTALAAAEKAGPRGANEMLEGGASAAGKSSPLDMMGNVANIAGVGMTGFEMFKSEKKPESSSTSHYESQLD